MNNVPSVGSRVKVTTKYANAYIHSSDKYQYFHYIGEVIRPDVWLKSNEFNLKTGNKNYPVSTISLNNVESIELISSATTTVRRFKITSKTSGKEYTVLVDNNEYQCSCPGWQFRGKCKHTAAVQKRIG